MADRTESADERALRRELQEVAKKRQALDNSKRRGSGTAAIGGTNRRGSVFSRLGSDSARAGGANRHFVQLKENTPRSNASRRLGKRESGEDDHHSNTVKRQRLHSAVSRPDGVRHGEGEAEASSRASSNVVTSPTANSARAQERKQRAVAPYAQKEGIARSRRMFGALMGHLGKAKRQIEKDTDLFKRQDTKQHEAEQREKMQSQDLENRARREAEILRLETLVTRTELDRSEQIARAKLEHLQTVRKSESQSKFLVTIASPPIYYLPSKHTKETKELVAASMEAHEAKMKDSGRSHEEKLRKLEAEFATKLEQLREELETLKNGEKEKSGEQASPSEKNDDARQDADADMDRAGSERDEEKDEQENADEGTEVTDGSSAIEVEDEDIGTESQADNNSSAETRRNNDGEKEDKTTVKSDLEHGSKGERDASPRKIENGTNNTEVLSPSQVKEEEVKEQSESEEPKLNDKAEQTAITKESKEAGPEVQSDAEVAEKDDSPKPEDAASETPKEDPAAFVDKLKVTELRAELKKRGLDIKGLKATLVQRLQQAVRENGP